MPMLKDPGAKYRPAPAINLPDRRWPNQRLTQSPIWMSTDLRDGNQALFEPMDGPTKLRLFQRLVAIGFKEIEVAFPAASQTDFDFVRTLITQGHIPQDVTIEVITQAREDLIVRTFEALRGARRAIVHLYNATAPAWRHTVFGMSRDEVIELAVGGARLIQQLAQAQPDTQWVFQYSPETFSATEPDFALQICDAVTEVWQPTAARPVIINLPATVEGCTPNVYADQIEWMHRHLARRDAIVLSVHPHNDRGTAVAAAELAVMAGAQRVEGCLFGNGERTGNVDLVTLALNLYSQGVDPGLDFSDLPAVTRLVEQCIQLPVHPRHPYAGDLVFTAFSGSHQDAIRKGFAGQRGDQPWSVPYLPIDPADVGGSYESVVRVNSQSGKGGVTFLLETNYGLVLPRRAQVEFSKVVQAHADEVGVELTPPVLLDLFRAHFMERPAPVVLVSHEISEGAQGECTVLLTLRMDGREHVVAGQGNGPLDAAWHALSGLAIPVEAQLRGFEEHAVAHGSDASALAWVEIGAPALGGSAYGAGCHPNIATAAIQALVQAVNGLWARQSRDGQTLRDPNKMTAGT